MEQSRKRGLLVRIGSFLFLLSFFLGSAAVSADEVRVTASVDRNQMRPGDTFTYSISISSDGAASFDQPRLPDLRGFEMIGSWTSSQTTGSFVNGQMRTQRSQMFNYKLVAQQPGRFTIGAAEVVVNGQEARTNPIQIEVSDSAPQGPSPQQQAQPDQQDPYDQLQDMEDDLFSQLLRRRMRPPSGGGTGGGRLLPPSNTADAFYVHVEADKTRVYQGEQILVSWYLVSRAGVQIADIDTLKYPSLTGFWKEDIEIATRLNFQPEVINGVQYQRALLARYALFPIKSGKAEIDPYQARCRVLYANAIGFPQDAQITKLSESIPIEVLPLPADSQPVNFTGAVGDFTVSAKVDASTLKANTPLNLKVRIEGVGNAKVADMPKFELPSHVQVYDTKTDMKFFPNGRSYKEFETLLVPTAAGEFKIPAIDFAFFDPVKKAYYVQKTSEMTIQVSPGDSQGVISSAPLEVTKPEMKEKNPELPGVLSTEDFVQVWSASEQVGVWSGVYLFTLLGLAIYGRSQLRAEERREGLQKMIKRKLNEIQKHLSQDHSREVGIESIQLITDVIANIAGMGGAAFDFDRLVEGAPPSFKRDVAPKLKSLMTKFELIGFAPEDVVGQWKEKGQLKKLVGEMESLLAEAAKYDFTRTDKESART